MYKILFVDDEKDFREIVFDYMNAKGLDVTVASCGKDAIEIIKQKKFDVIILDVLMPYMNGFELCQLIKKQMNTPIIFMSALGDETHLLEGYKAGGDDYIVKPFPLSVLYEKIMLLENKNSNSHGKNIISVSGVDIDIKSRKVYVDGVEVTLTTRDFDILKFLMINKNTVINRDLLISRIWGIDFFGDARVVDTHIKIIRKALGIKADLIKTIINSGYRFEEV